MSIFGWSLVLNYGLALTWNLIPDLWFLGIVAWVVSGVVLVWTSIQMEPILPFVPLSKAAHYAMTALLVLCGFLGLLTWAAYRNSVNTASDHLELLESQTRKSTTEPPSETKPQPSKLPQFVPVESESYNAWVDTLRTYLTSKRISTTVEDFRPDALRYGYGHKMPPDAFLKYGYNKVLSAEELADMLANPEAYSVAVAVEPKPQVDKGGYVWDEVQQKGVLRMGKDTDPAALVELLRMHSNASSTKSPAGRKDKGTENQSPTEISKSDAEQLKKPNSALPLDKTLEQLFKLYSSGAISEAEFIQLRDSDKNTS